MQSPSEKIQPYARPRAYKKGTSLFFQGEAPSAGVIITSGFVRSYTITTSGEERTIAFFTTDDILPLSWLMGTTTATLFYYEALTDVRTLQFSRDDFATHILGDKEALLLLFKTLSRDHTAAMLRINGLEQSRADEKVAFTLYYLAFRYGTPDEKQEFFTIGITLRHSTIASLVGLSRESTTKILVALQKRRLLYYKNGIYRVHRDRLEKYIGEDAFHDVRP